MALLRRSSSGARRALQTARRSAPRRVPPRRSGTRVVGRVGGRTCGWRLDGPSLKIAGGALEAEPPATAVLPAPFHRQAGMGRVAGVVPMPRVAAAAAPPPIAAAPPLAHPGGGSGGCCLEDVSIDDLQAAAAVAEAGARGALDADALPLLASMRIDANMPAVGVGDRGDGNAFAGAAGSYGVGANQAVPGACAGATSGGPTEEAQQEQKPYIHMPELYQRPSLPVACPPVILWHCKHPHGLFSCLSLALGHAERCEQNGWVLVVDWSGEEMLYRGPSPEEPNVWTAFFQQPAEVTVRPEVLQHALRTGQYTLTTRHDDVFGQYRGVIQDWGGIPVQLAEYGRALCQRNLVLRDKFRMKVEAAIEQLLPRQYTWLAVHIRRGDKAVEAAVNFELTDDDLVSRIIQQCNAWHCDGVFLCTDDAALKERLQTRLEGNRAAHGDGFRVSVYPSTLSTASGQGTHFDKTLDAYRKAEDVMMEAYCMARGCSGLLSTFSNVSAGVVYLSPGDFPYTTFWDPVEHFPGGLALPGDAHAPGAAAGQCCGKFKGAGSWCNRRAAAGAGCGGIGGILPAAAQTAWHGNIFGACRRGLA